MNNVTVGIENAKYQVSLMYNIVSNWYTPTTHEWWTEMDGRIYVGAIPLKDKNLLAYYYKYESHCDQLKELGITDVISMNKEFELNSATLLSTPVSVDDWKKNGIVQHIFETGDFKAISVETINKCITLIENILKDVNKKIYLHCKAGKGRSIIIYACYLIKKNPSLPIQEILKYISNKRSTASLNEEQLQNIHDYYEQLV
jgi:atypical dual specificity phosphatase